MAQTKKSIDKLSYEDALEQLEAIVESMESGDIPLEDLVKKYEEGHKLLTHCNQRIKNVELKIQALKDNELKPFDTND